MKKRKSVKEKITAGTTTTWNNDSGDCYLHCVEVASTDGTPNTTITLDHVVDSNDHLLMSQADTALDTVVYIPENVIQISKGDDLKITSTTSGSFSVVITLSLEG